MQDFFEKLKEYPENKRKWAQILIGVMGGLLVILTIFFASRFNDALISLSFIVVFVAIIFVRNKLRNVSEWDTKILSIAMIVSIGIALAYFIIYGIVNGL